jgi:hypothetical protein
VTKLQKAAWCNLLLCTVCIFPFFVLGRQNIIKVYYLTLILFGTLLTAQFVHSVTIPVICTREDDDGQ